MSQASDYLENALIGALFSKTSAFGLLATPPDFYVALCTVAVTDSMTGTTITEPTSGEYNEYARIEVVTANWVNPSGGLIDNSAKITFPKVLTGTGVTLTHFAVCDALTTGNMLFYGTLDVEMPIVVGSTPEFEIGDLNTTLS